jgi:DNA repair photolyase
MPKYEQICPVHNEIDIYTNCSFNCIYCISLSDPLIKSFNLDAELARIASLTDKSKPYYLSPWTDCYQEEEEQRGYTRKILEALSKNNIPFFVITKGDLVLRDIDLFKGKDNAFLAISINTLSNKLISKLEPGAPSATNRKNLLEKLIQHKDLKTVVKIDPIIPGITDGEELDDLIAWLCQHKPKAITADTLRLSNKILSNMQKHLSKETINRMLKLYPEIAESPIHANIEYRLELLKTIAAKLRDAGIQVSFCKASIPERITDFDCRGGYNYDF